MGAHSTLSPSSSDRWLNCPASVLVQKKGNKASIYSDEGTFAHAIAELCLTNNVNANFYLTNKIPPHVYDTTFDIYYDAEMAEYVQIYVDYVRSFQLDFKVEHFADYSKYVPNSGGTADCLMYDKTAGALHVLDLKYGKGIKVFAKDNTQAMLYALGSVINSYPNAKSAILTIVQPRLDHIDTWEIATAELFKFAEYAKTRAELVYSKNPPFNAGKHCRWCTIKAECSYSAKLTEKTILERFDRFKKPDPSLLTAEQMKNVLDNKKVIIGFLNAVEKKALDDLSNGVPFLGYKLVKGVGRNVWVENADLELIKLLDSETSAYNKKIISVGSAQKLLGKDVVQNLIVKSEGKPVLAKESDSGESLADAASLFSNLDALEK